MEENRYIELLTDIQEAEIVLVGLGEEFDGIRSIKKMDGYEEGLARLKQNGQENQIPLLQKMFREKSGIDEKIKTGLLNLCEALQDKNYFVISVSTNEMIAKIPWKNDHCVMPCGNVLKMQCNDSCESNLQELDEDVLGNLQGKLEAGVEVSLGKCPVCGKERVFNTVYSEEYCEAGYLDSWNKYTKWLQGTLNKKLVVLELGVGMNFPSVIRFPFEKIVYFNQKSKMYRINENLYHLTEEIAGKGVGIANNAIDCLENLC